jgi:hypothetical protein
MKVAAKFGFASPSSKSKTFEDIQSIFNVKSSSSLVLVPTSTENKEDNNTVININGIESKKLKKDAKSFIYSIRDIKTKEWSEIETKEISSIHKTIFDINCDGFHFEFGRDNIIYDFDNQLEDINDQPYYQIYFYGKGKF